MLDKFPQLADQFKETKKSKKEQRVDARRSESEAFTGLDVIGESMAVVAAAAAVTAVAASVVMQNADFETFRKSGMLISVTC